MRATLNAWLPAHTRVVQVQVRSALGATHPNMRPPRLVNASLGVCPAPCSANLRSGLQIADHSAQDVEASLHVGQLAELVVRVVGRHEAEASHLKVEALTLE
jgi:hypothetical protein